MKGESLTSFIQKWRLNFFPCYRGTGGRVSYIQADWKKIRVKLSLDWRTVNYVGTLFGGSLYGSVDPMYMLMLIRILGPEYIVWDKGANIRFLKPGRSTLYADFEISDEEIATIKQLLQHEKAIDRVYTVELVDKDGVLHAQVEKILYIRKRSP